MCLKKWNWNFRLENREFRQGKQDYLFRPSFTPGNFPLERPRNGKVVKYLKDAGKRRVGSVCLGGMGF